MPDWGAPLRSMASKLAAVVAALDGGATRAAVRRTFGTKRSTLIDSLAWIGVGLPASKCRGA